MAQQAKVAFLAWLMDQLGCLGIWVSAHLLDNPQNIPDDPYPSDIINIISVAISFRYSLDHGWSQKLISRGARLD
jgi:hypothetical protein